MFIGFIHSALRNEALKMTAANLSIVSVSYNPFMIHLNLLAFQNDLKYRQQDGNSYLYDPVRKKWIQWTPEEIVRQLLLLYLLHSLKYSPSLVQEEKKLLVNGLTRRYDILIYDRGMKPYLLVECKAPEILINQDVFDQIARYNSSLRVPFLLVSNGKEHYCCKMNYDDASYTFLNNIPHPE